MVVKITDWGLQSYLKIIHKNLMPRDEYRQVIRPDVERFRLFPADPMFSNSRRWGPAKVGSHHVADGFKMKWHNLTHMDQLRLCVAVIGATAYICQAYNKTSPALDRRQCLKFEANIKALKAHPTAHIKGTLP